jgi:transposase
LADWLLEHGIDTVVMESTGVYWIALFQILERRGLEVKLVNARHVKNLPGRKSDISDCQWLQQLHTFGLLNGSFRPKDEVCVLRSFLRLRDSLVKDCSSHILRMQKALTEMNLQIHRVLSDLTGYSGMAIIRAILAGERDPVTLAREKAPPGESAHRADRPSARRRLSARAPLCLADGRGALRRLSTQDRGM